MRIHICFKTRALQVEKKRYGLYQLGGLVLEKELESSIAALGV